MANINEFVQCSVGKFDGQGNFQYWDSQMEFFFKVMEYTDVMINGFTDPGDQATLTQNQREEMVKNWKKDSRALMYIFVAIDPAIYEKIAHVSTSKEAWDVLINSYIGRDKVKKSVIIFRDQTKILAKRKGRITIKLRDGLFNSISDVYYVPSLRHNFLSLEQLSKKGYDIWLLNGVCTISDASHELIAKIILERNLMMQRAHQVMLFTLALVLSLGHQRSNKFWLFLLHKQSTMQPPIVLLMQCG
ncbi:unnamed protein product [Prunus armeniaca]|uniref:Retrovirus-related Pol polyprotein from transposon TNT 1-94-like beta-barrel domain-containing protein n=1 Tax=Prunus armeniaca TaxID=36596 RepID=A0A6J5VR68_PRUAR|nr:unnamed protein product [Prunus armeniaca]